MSPSLRSTSTENILECLCRVLVLKKHKTLLKIPMKTTHLLIPSFTLYAFYGVCKNPGKSRNYAVLISGDADVVTYGGLRTPYMVLP